MSKQQNQLKDRLNRTFSKTKEASRICSVPGCTKTAINSHILQKNGILNSISEQNHVRLLGHDFFKDNLAFFKRVGVNEAFTFKGFCSEHDSEIFKPIEGDEIDFDDYQNQLLFAYRTVLNELVKKTINIEWRKRQRNDDVLKNVVDFEMFRKTDVQERLGIEDIKYGLNKILEDFDGVTQQFVFKVRSVSSKEVCLASHFTFESVRTRNEKIRDTGKDFERLTDIFVSFFPLDGENVFMIGYLKEFEDRCGKFVQDFFDCSEVELLKKISNLLLCRCEMWTCSEAFYKTNILPREKTILDIIQDSAINIDEDRDLNINLFE
jgi:hypothetical protein